jgi:hypothetical protein
MLPTFDFQVIPNMRLHREILGHKLMVLHVSEV